MARKNFSKYAEEKPRDPFAVNKCFEGDDAENLRKLRNILAKQRGRAVTNTDALNEIVRHALPVYLKSLGL